MRMCQINFGIFFVDQRKLDHNENFYDYSILSFVERLSSFRGDFLLGIAESLHQESKIQKV